VDAVFAARDVGAVPVKVTVESDVAPALATLESVMRTSAVSNSLLVARTSLKVIGNHPLTRP